MTRAVRWKLVLWGTLALATGAQATPARMAALLGNPLFEDDTNSAAYPSLAARFGRAASLHLAAGGGTQVGLLLGDDEWLVGASHGAPPAYDDLARIGEEVGRPVLRPTRLLSALAVWKLEGDSAIGFAVTPSFGITRNYPPPGAPITNTLSLELEAIAGLTLGGSDVTTDLALAVSYHRFQQRSGGVTVVETPQTPSAALRTRTFFKGAIGEGGDLAVYGELARRERTFIQHEPFTSRANLARYVVLAGMGPRYRPVEWATIGAAVELSYVLLTGGVDTAGLGFSRATLPSLQLAAELSPVSWLVLRGAVARRFMVTTSRPQAGGQTDVSSDSFTWATGAGIRYKRLEIDATISTALLLEGPAFIGGGTPGLFGSLSARYPF